MLRRLYERHIIPKVVKNVYKKRGITAIEEGNRIFVEHCNKKMLVFINLEKIDESGEYYEIMDEIKREVARKARRKYEDIETYFDVCIVEFK